MVQIPRRQSFVIYQFLVFQNFGAFATHVDFYMTDWVPFEFANLRGERTDIYISDLFLHISSRISRPAAIERISRM